MTIKVDSRRSIFSELKDYCYFSKAEDYMEVTEWSNGEGYDIEIQSNVGNQKFSLTYGEYELLQVLINYKGE